MSSLRNASAKRIAEMYRNGDISLEELLEKTNDDTLITVLEELRNIQIQPVILSQDGEEFYIVIGESVKVNLDEILGVEFNYDGVEQSRYKVVKRDHSPACGQFERYIHKSVDKFYYVPYGPIAGAVQEILAQEYDKVGLIDIGGYVFITINMIME